MNNKEKDHNNADDVMEVTRLLMEFFHLNKIPKPVASTAMLGLFMTINQDLRVSVSELDKTFKMCMKRYRELR